MQRHRPAMGLQLHACGRARCSALGLRPGRSGARSVDPPAPPRGVAPLWPLPACDGVARASAQSHPASAHPPFEMLCPCQCCARLVPSRRGAPQAKALQVARQSTLANRQVPQPLSCQSRPHAPVAATLVRRLAALLPVRRVDDEPSLSGLGGTTEAESSAGRRLWRATARGKDCAVHQSPQPGQAPFAALAKPQEEAVQGRSRLTGSPVEQLCAHSTEAFLPAPQVKPKMLQPSER